MEPLDIDSIIKQKLKEDNTLYQRSSASARPLVWEAVRRNISERAGLAWYHLAAAAVLLVLVFAAALYGLQRKYDQQLTLLTQQVDEMQSESHAQRMKLTAKETRLTQLEQKLNKTEQQLTTLRRSAPASQKVLVRTDTVYVPQVKYLTVDASPVAAKKVVVDTTGRSSDPPEGGVTQKLATDQAIFATSSTRPVARPAETIRVTFGPFTRKN